MSCVTLPWVQTLPWKMQSILFSGLRGPDDVRCAAVKSVSKWMRGVSQGNADPSKKYMTVEGTDLDELMEELEMLPCHFVHHFADALRVIAHGHHDRDVRVRAFEIHALIAEELFHFIPEQPEIFAWRHRDLRDGTDPQPVKPFDDRTWMDQCLPEEYVHA